MVLAAEPIYVLVDTAVVGHLGRTPLAALSVSGSIMSFTAWLGAVLAYGSFVTVAINFIILAFIIFLMIKQMNRLKREAPPAAPAAPPEDVVLLREIRDALKK